MEEIKTNVAQETATDVSEKATEPKGEAAEASDGVFELRQTPKPENLKEMYFHYFFGRVPAIILISIFALYGLLGIGLLAYEIYRGQFEINSVIIIVLAFGMIAYRIFCYRTYSRLAFKRKEELGVVAEVVMKVGRESMYPEGHPESALRFTDIKRAYVTKNLVYLVTRAKNIVVFEKESFTVGDCKSFLSRLSRLGVKVPKKV